MIRVLIILLFITSKAFGQIPDFLNLPVASDTTYSAEDNVTIIGKQFTHRDDSISQNGNILRFLGGNNITIKHCYFPPNQGDNNDGGDRAIYATGGSNITIDSCLFSGNGGMILISSWGNGITITNNQALNPRGPYPTANMVQLNTCIGTGYNIKHQRVRSWLGESFPEDIFSIYNSDNALIDSNYVLGGGPSRSGGGAVVGEVGGSNNTISNNRAYNMGQYGFAIYGGDGNNILNNWVWSDKKPWSANGMPVYNGYDPCTNVTVTGNKSHLICGYVPYPGESDRCTRGSTNNGWFPTVPPDACTHLSVQTVASLEYTDTAGMGLPNPFITFITDDQQKQLRHQMRQYDAEIIMQALWTNGNQKWRTSIVSRPNVDAGGDQNLSSSSTTLTCTASTFNSDSTVISAYSWVKVSGPAGGTIVSPTSSSTSITDLETGTYVYRVDVTEVTTATEHNTYYDGVALTKEDFDWITLNVTISSPTGIKMPVKFAAINNPIEYKHNWASR